MNQPSTASRKPFHRLLLTGAAGNLGRQLRAALADWADIVRVSDIADARRCRRRTRKRASSTCADRQAVMHLVEGVDAIVHLGGISIDAPFDDLLEANIRRHLQPVRGGPQARREARRVRELESRDRLSSGHRGARRATRRSARTACTA